MSFNGVMLGVAKSGSTVLVVGGVAFVGCLVLFLVVLLRAAVRGETIGGFANVVAS